MSPSYSIVRFPLSVPSRSGIRVRLWDSDWMCIYGSDTDSTTVEEALTDQGHSFWVGRTIDYPNGRRTLGYVRRTVYGLEAQEDYLTRIDQLLAWSLPDISFDVDVDTVTSALYVDTASAYRAYAQGRCKGPEYGGYA